MSSCVGSITLVPSKDLSTTLPNTTQIRPQYFRKSMCVHWDVRLKGIQKTLSHVLSHMNTAQLSILYLDISPHWGQAAPRGSAILGQPLRKTKQALYYPLATKIQEQLVLRRGHISCHTDKNSYFYLILAKRP